MIINVVGSLVTETNIIRYDSESEAINDDDDDDDDSGGDDSGGDDDSGGGFCTTAANRLMTNSGDP